MDPVSDATPNRIERTWNATKHLIDQKNRAVNVRHHYAQFFWCWLNKAIMGSFS